MFLFLAKKAVEFLLPESLSADKWIPIFRSGFIVIGLAVVLIVAVVFLKNCYTTKQITDTQDTMNNLNANTIAKGIESNQANANLQKANEATKNVIENKQTNVSLTEANKNRCEFLKSIGKICEN